MSPNFEAPWKDLVARFDAAIPDLWEPHPKPTTLSTAKINAHFRLEIPQAIYSLAARSTRFSNIFLSFGDNFEAHNHVVPYNRYWRARRRTRKLPTNLIIISQGFMDEDFWCIDKSAPDGSGGFALQFWSPAPVGHPRGGVLGERLSCFEALVETVIEHHLAVKR